MENFRLFNEDAINGMKGLISQNIKVDCIITDPPYKLTSKGSTGTMGGEFWTSERSKKGILFDTPDITDWINLCYDLLNEGTHIYIMTNDKNLTHYLDTIKKSKFEFVKTIIWVKPNKITGRFYMTQKETIILARKGGQRPINHAGTSDILFSPEFKKLKKEDGTNYHDTEKPVSLMETLVLNSTNEGECVFDPFTGVGATGVASLKNNRQFLGFEINQDYAKKAEERLNEVNQ